MTKIKGTMKVVTSGGQLAWFPVELTTSTKINSNVNSEELLEIKDSLLESINLNTDIKSTLDNFITSSDVNESTVAELINAKLQLTNLGTKIGDLNQLATEDKTSLVAAINEAAQSNALKGRVEAIEMELNGILNDLTSI